MLRQFIADLVELELDGADMAELSQPDQFLDMLDRWPRAGVRPPQWRGDGMLRLVLPLQLQELANGFQQPGNIDWLQQVAVVIRLRQRGAMRFQRTRRHHQDARLMMAGRAQGLRNGPA